MSDLILKAFSLADRRMENREGKHIKDYVDLREINYGDNSFYSVEYDIKSDIVKVDKAKVKAEAKIRNVIEDYGERACMPEEFLALGFIHEGTHRKHYRSIIESSPDPVTYNPIINEYVPYSEALAVFRVLFSNKDIDFESNGKVRVKHDIINQVLDDIQTQNQNCGNLFNFEDFKLAFRKFRNSVKIDYKNYARYVDDVVRAKPFIDKQVM